MVACDHAADYEPAVDFGAAAGVDGGVGVLLLSAAEDFVSDFVSGFVSDFVSDFPSDAFSVFGAESPPVELPLDA